MGGFSAIPNTRPKLHGPSAMGPEGVELEKASAPLELTVKGDRFTGLLGVIPGDPGMERDILV